MIEGRDAQGKWLKGRSANPKGRPKGIIDKRQLMQKALGEGADAIIAVVKSRALEGDMQAASIVMARLVPTLKAEGALVRFELDSALPVSQQFAQVMQAIADGQLTVDEGKQLVEMIRLQAEARAAEGGGENRDRLVDLFKRMAESGMDASVPYTPNTLTRPASATPAAAPAPPPPPTAPGARHQLAVKRPWEK